MMSYLWILLLGSLLATGAKAQDDAPTEEKVAPETPVPVEAAPEVDGEPDKETDDMTKEMAPTMSASEPTAEPEAEVKDSVAPAGGDTEPAALGEDKTEPAALGEHKTEPAAPVGDITEPPAPEEDKTEPTAGPLGDITEPAAPEEDKTEPAVPAGDIAEPSAHEEDKIVTPAPVGDFTEPAAPEEGKTEPANPAGGKEEAATTAAEDTDAAATTKEPAVNPETDQPEAHAEEETTVGTDTTSAPVENGHDDVAQTATDLAEDDKEEPTEIANATNSIFFVEGIVPVLGTGNEEIVAPKVNAAHVSGSAANDEQKTKEASSSSVVGTVCGIAVAAVGAVAGYFTYQKKKLCFKNRQEADPEAARKADAAEAQSDPQVLSNLLNSS